MTFQRQKTITETRFGANRSHPVVYLSCSVDFDFDFYLFIYLFIYFIFLFFFIYYFFWGRGCFLHLIFQLNSSLQMRRLKFFNLIFKSTTLPPLLTRQCQRVETKTRSNFSQNINSLLETSVYSDTSAVNLLYRLIG